ncbi:nucleoside/nucleotide kinase family protein [Paracoccaceae bacterium GXU_MW_L88]
MSEPVTRAELVDRLRALDLSTRKIVAIVGAPGAGKSTIVEDLAGAVPGAAILPMDGYHYDDMVLVPRGDRPRKGAPWTYDVDGLATTLARLAADDGRDVAVPVFDRSIEIARAGARIITPEARLILVEGNYLLLDRDGWRDLARHYDLTILLDVPLEVIEARLAARWKDMTPEDAAVKIGENDLPNARIVIDESRPADLRLKNG